MADPTTIRIPDELKPVDGRFGCGPSKIRPAAVSALADVATSYLGTSHRQKTVRDQVARLRRGLAEFFSLPEGYEVVLGNGGTTAFWEVATFGLIRDRAQFASFGEFGAKFAKSVAAAPFLGEPTVRKAEPGSAPALVAEAGVDAYARRRTRPPPVSRSRSSGSPAPTRARCCWSTPPPPPAAWTSTWPRPTSTTSPRRSASPPTAASGWP